MSDEGFHEIQLNGKQIIFLCMTAALVLVVAFLSGVLVGRGVRTQKDGILAAEAAAVPSVPAGDAAPAASTPSASAAPPITAIAPPTPTDEDLSYNSRLEDKQPPKETVKPESATPAKKAAALADAPVPPASRTTAAKPEAAFSAEPAGDGYYVKVVAYRERSQAEKVARRLSGKGYSAYIVPLSGRGLYSVCVGKFKSRREADSTRRRLEKEEQFKPLISH